MNHLDGSHNYQRVSTWLVLCPPLFAPILVTPYTQNSKPKTLAVECLPPSCLLVSKIELWICLCW